MLGLTIPMEFRQLENLSKGDEPLVFWNPSTRTLQYERGKVSDLLGQVMTNIHLLQKLGANSSGEKAGVEFPEITSDWGVCWKSTETSESDPT